MSQGQVQLNVGNHWLARGRALVQRDDGRAHRVEVRRVVRAKEELAQDGVDVDDEEEEQHDVLDGAVARLFTDMLHGGREVPQLWGSPHR